ncbi:MAG TPA: EamA family transporter [Rhizomicrobium sp.]|nr:EamA family transporter [Rhizomicrobium sp.]
MNPIAVILVTVVLSAVAQIALKSGVTALKLQDGQGIVGLGLAVAASPFIWLGLVIYGLSVLAWLWVLSKVDVSFAYPFVGLSFVLTVAMGALVLHEPVTPLRWAGTLLVIGGCVLIARSAA